MIVQLGMVCLFLWIPVLGFPWLQVQRSGVLADLMAAAAAASTDANTNSRPNLMVYFWQLPALLWQQGVQAGTPRWSLALVLIVGFATLFAVPLIVTVLGIMVWLVKTTTTATTTTRLR